MKYRRLIKNTKNKPYKELHMQERKSPELTPDSSPEITKKFPELTAEELQEMGLSIYFDFYSSDERDDLMHTKMNELVTASLTRQYSDSSMVLRRDKYVAFMDQVRKSEYFLSLQARFERNEKLSPGEYTYFALTTDDVNKLNPQALREMREFYHYQNFDANLDVLIAARDWQE